MKLPFMLVISTAKKDTNLRLRPGWKRGRFCVYSRVCTNATPEKKPDYTLDV
jgi:hypothetical protein